MNPVAPIRLEKHCWPELSMIASLSARASIPCRYRVSFGADHLSARTFSMSDSSLSSPMLMVSPSHHVW